MIRNLPERGGWLELVYGPMFSGKSEELIRRLRRAEIAAQRVLTVGGLDSYEARCGACYRPGAAVAAVAETA